MSRFALSSNLRTFSKTTDFDVSNDVLQFTGATYVDLTITQAGGDALELLSKVVSKRSSCGGLILV